VLAFQDGDPDGAFGLVGRGAPLRNLAQCAEAAVAQAGLRMHGADAGAGRRHGIAFGVVVRVETLHERILRAASYANVVLHT